MLDPDAVAEIVAGADVVVHLAFVIMGSAEETSSVNLRGSHNVFDAAIGGGVARLVYASSVAAYGFHADNPALLTEDLPAAGTRRHYYSAQKAELEEALAERLRAPTPPATCFDPASSPGPTRWRSCRASPTCNCQSTCPRRCSGRWS